MTIKEVTQQMLYQIRGELNRNKKVTDKEIAEKLELTQASFSRLITAVTEPKIKTWVKICKLHKTLCGNVKNYEIIKNIT